MRKRKLCEIVNFRRIFACIPIFQMDMFIFINEMLSRKRYKEHEVRQYIRSDETILKCEHIWI